MGSAGDGDDDDGDGDDDGHDDHDDDDDCDDDDDDAVDGADDGFAWIDDEGDKSGLSWPCKGTCTTSLLSSSIMPLVQEL